MSTGRGLKRTYSTFILEDGDLSEHILEEKREQEKYVRLSWVKQTLSTSCMGKKLLQSVISHGHYQEARNEKHEHILQYVPPSQINATINSCINTYHTHAHYPLDHLEQLVSYDKVDGDMNPVEKQLEVQKLMENNKLQHAPAYPRCKCTKCKWYKHLSFIPYADKRKALPDTSLLKCSRR